MNNKLEPRAKIGDIVIVIIDSSVFQCRIDTAVYQDYDDGCDSEWYYGTEDDRDLEFIDKDILKNLTTGKKYGNE